LDFGLKIRRIPIEDSFDLHSFLPEDVREALADYLAAATERGFREVRVIHGKGKGVRRAEVRRWLATSPHALDFFDAAPERGGVGATIVVLNPKSKI
jgi:DNA-nicking Smr family endonuclease